MINRREFLEITAGAGAALALTPGDVFAFQTRKLLQRAIPSSGEMLPAISFAPRPVVTPSGRTTYAYGFKKNKKTVLDNGGKRHKVLHAGPAIEQAARTAAAELGIQNRFFWTSPLNVPPPGSPAAKTDPGPKAALDEKFAAFKVQKIDLVLLSASTAVDEPTHLAFLRERK